MNNMVLDFKSGDQVPDNFATNHKWGDIVINDEKQFYRESQVEQRDDALYLVGEPQADGTWLSGLIGTNGTDWVTRHDSPWEVEAEINVPKGPGLLPAFWARPTFRREGEPGILPELDAMESPELSTMYSGIHTRVAADGQTILQSLRKIECATMNLTGWNRYGLKYDVDRYYFTINGAVIHTVPVPLDHRGRDWYWILNLAIGGNWPGDPTDQTPYPVEMGIRSLRISQDYNANRDVIDRIDTIESEAINCIKAAADRQRIELS